MAEVVERTTARRSRGRMPNARGKASGATRRNQGSGQPREQIVADLDRMISALIRENSELHRQIDRLSRQASAGTSRTDERALRSLQVRISRAVDSGGTSRRSRTTGAAKASTRRRKVTDPVVLEGRRQTLAKAREAWAAKLAAGS